MKVNLQEAIEIIGFKLDKLDFKLACISILVKVMNHPKDWKNEEKDYKKYYKEINKINKQIQKIVEVKKK